MSSKSEIKNPVNEEQKSTNEMKENDEEWISGEELSTEGSSDEGTNKDKPKKEKKKRTRRMFPPTVVICKKSQSNINSDLTEVKTIQSTSEGPENYIQWKPKRGSIKLPELPEDIPSLRHQIWQLNVKHDEMIDNLQTLKKTLDDKSIKIPPIDENSEQTLKELYKSEFENIENLEDELDMSSDELKEITTERIKMQKEICNQIILLNSRPFEYKSSQQFHKMCNFQMRTDDELIMNKVPVRTSYKKFKTEKLPSLRHKKSSKLEKKLKMDLPPLTDEEKCRINFLLSDELFSDHQQKKVTTDSLNCFGSDYKLKDDEKKLLDGLDEKLKVLQENSLNNLRKNVSVEVIQGWNKHFISERLKQIDEQLTKYKDNIEQTSQDK